MAQVIHQLLHKCFMRGDEELKTADICGAQWELVFYVGKSLVGNGWVCGSNGCPLIRDKLLHKNYSIRLPKEYFMKQNAVKKLGCDVKKD